MKKKLLAILVSAAMAVSLAACGGPSESASVDGEQAAGENAGSEGVSAKVAVITMDQVNVYWSYIAEGAKAQAETYNAEGNNIEVEWLAPETADNTLQIQQIESAIANGVDYIAIACIDTTAQNMALQEAIDAGIKIIYVDSPAELEAEVTFATDNYQCGVDAGEYMMKTLQEKGIKGGLIGIIDGQAGSNTCTSRYEGFASVFEGTGYEISERMFCEGDVAKAQEFANTLINNGAVGLYGTDNNATNGLGAAIGDAKNNGIEVLGMGWDTSDKNITYIENGSLLAFMAQNPDLMGAYAIDTVVSLEKGEAISETSVNTGATVVTTENVGDYK
ncbi:substrate-binding domain-containing protein [Lactonifactor longoviformis]|uniref:substrate-binding domain-containing protein n=1 Tax=Lactonifactor longoviformis TaxID=341220 RepID=UPI0036F1F480